MIDSGAKMRFSIALALAPLCLLHAQSPQRFDPAQSEMGRSDYTRNCAQCHGQNLDDGEFAPPLKGADFNAKWGGKPADTLLT
jgi:mono/diheme cytochrome c family protein